MKYFLHVLVMGMLFSLHSFSQTINYKPGVSNGIPDALPDANCNLFYVTNPITIGGLQHYPVAGGVLYKKSDNAISLNCQSGDSRATMLGTAYAIKSSFKEGYTYTIKAQAWQLVPTSTRQAYLSFTMLDQLPDPNKTHPGACGPVDQDKWWDLANTVISQTALDTNKTNRDVGTFLMNQNYNYLTLVAWMNPNSDHLSTTCRISQLTIIETPPTYTLAPVSISKVCGTAISQTFTITDVHNSGKVSYYTWDLTSDNNGWLYNGAPAPRYITTNTPSLTLTANDCSAPTNVTATATRPNGNFTTNTTAVTTTNNVTLNGPSKSCGGASTFTVSNLTCGDVTWSLSPGAIGILSNTTGPTTTLTTPAQDQSLTVYANIATTCLPKTISKPFKIITKPVVGISGEINCQEGNIVVPQQFYAYANDADTYYWSWRSGSGSTGTFPSHTADVSKKFSLGSWTVYCYATNICGQGETDEYEFDIHRCGLAASEREDVSVALSPNPASNVVVITAHTTNSALKVAEKQEIREVRIIDKTGKLLRKQWFSAGTTSANIHVESFKPDIYILQIGDGKTFITRKIRIAR